MQNIDTGEQKEAAWSTWRRSWRDRLKLQWNSHGPHRAFGASRIRPPIGLPTLRRGQPKPLHCLFLRASSSNRDRGFTLPKFAVSYLLALINLSQVRTSRTIAFQLHLELAPQAVNNATLLEVRVPTVYPTWANVLFLAFSSFNEINKLCVISRGQNSDSPRLHHFRRRK